MWETASPHYIWGMTKCIRCQDVAWVCENHPDRPWSKTKPNGCECGAGMPCPDCNPSDADNPPRLGEAMTIVEGMPDKDRDR